MSACPVCATPLRPVRQREGVFFHCPECDGRAVSFPQIRRVAGDRFATQLLRQLNTTAQPGRQPCPFCRQPMRVFVAREPRVTLDACRTCGAVWFDPHEFEAVPEGAVESPEEARLRALQALAEEQIKQERERNSWGEGPEESWKVLPALFGMPVETDVPALRGRPWLTWGLAVVVAAVSLAAFRDLQAAVQQFGFVPALAWRYGGLTALTAFFLHGGVLHLVSNLYFLLVFGDNVEDALGRWRYALLLLAATLAGAILHGALVPTSTVPCVGASGGISGVIVYYALRFPRARLGILFRYFLYFRWLQVPAWGALVLWGLLQLFGLWQQLAGFSSVAATAHLGGAAAGGVCWLCWRKLPAGEAGE